MKPTIHLSDILAEYCKKEGIILSRQIEKFITNKLKKVNKK